MEELLHDKHFLYYVGQLIGATEMVAHWMALQEDEDVKDMGDKLSETVNWFFTGSDKKPAVPSSEMTTKILPPK